MEFNKDKFSQYVMQRPYMGEMSDSEAEPGDRIVRHALDKAGCGDAYEIAIRVNSEGEIRDAKYITFGCGYAQATCGALIDSILGQSLEEVSSWSEQELGDRIEAIMGEYPVHKKAYLYFANELLKGVSAQPAPSA